MTAEDLLHRLDAAGLSSGVDSGDLVIVGDLPGHLRPVVGLMAAPLVALMTGKKLFAIDARGRGCRPGGEISPRELLPLDAHLLTVAGASAWSRVPADARDEYPQLFAQPTPARRAA